LSWHEIMKLFGQNVRNLVVLLAVLLITMPVWAANQPSTKVQRKPYQGGVSRTGFRVPVLDNDYSAGKASLDTSAYDQGNLEAGVADIRPMSGNLYERGPMGSGATVDIGGTPMTTKSQLQLLSTRNVAILVDRSSSMREKDCPGHISRWNWCQQQAELFSEQTAGVLSERFTLAFFAHHYDIYPSVTLDQMRRLFEHSKPKLGTHPEGALQEIFDAYFRGAMGSKPLVVAVISDGEPNDPDKVADVIRDATWQMKNPDQIAITFLQVGHGDDGTDILREFDQQLKRQGAKYDIVDRKSFYELQRLGLLGALVASIKATMPAVAKTPPSKPKPKAKPKLPQLRPPVKHR